MDLQSLTLRVKRNENLPMLPQVATTILRLVDDPRTTAKDLERAIERDMSLASKLLRVANSSYYAVSNVNTISRAVSVLGVNTVRSLVVSIAYQQMISGRSLSQNFQRAEFWSHSLGVGITSRVICKMLMPQKSEEMYLAGMMHDVGMLVLDRFIPTELDRVIAFARDMKIPLHEAEQELLGYDHAEVGGILAEQWGLTPAVTNAVRYHHNLMMDESGSPLTSIVALANSLAHRAGLGNHSAGQVELDAQALTTLNLTEEQLEVIGVVMVQEVMKAQQAFQIQIAA